MKFKSMFLNYDTFSVKKHMHVPTEVSSSNITVYFLTTQKYFLANIS